MRPCTIWTVEITREVCSAATKIPTPENDDESHTIRVNAFPKDSRLTFDKRVAYGR